MIKHNKTQNRFESALEGYLAVLEYRLQPDGLLFLTHTGVPNALGGRGVGSQLVRAALDWARQEGYRVRPLCWFAAGYIERHPEYQDLLA